MYVGSTAGESFVAKGAKEAGFEYGVAVRPEKYDLQQGTDIYMFEVLQLKNNVQQHSYT